MNKKQKKTLLIVTNERLSDFVHKGHIIKRYYNPGNLFDVVHFLVLKDEMPVDPEEVRPLFGTAEFHVHSYNIINVWHFLLTLFWRPFLINITLGPLIKKIKQLKPDLIRCQLAYNLPLYVGVKLKEELGIPCCISLHGNADVDNRNAPNLPLKHKIYHYSAQTIERYALQRADMVMPVYSSIIPYLERMKCKKYELLYNVINPGRICIKKDYTLGEKIKILCVNRQVTEKNPENLILAVQKLSNIKLTLIGEGALQQQLKQLVQQLKIENKVEFINNMPNTELLKLYPEYDIFANHCQYFGIGKTIIEAALSGLPIITNLRDGEQIDEYKNADWLMLVKNSPEGYMNAINKLVNDDHYREQLGVRARKHSSAIWMPEITEQRYVDLYKRLVPNL